ncbi:hypothetical protein [Streptomyces sp. NPDC047043]|uniref:hypothetical protein n=1 Tax=Streptomyces sp. NPDC047043 TaxID=3154497 RepID=UPI0033FBD09F
MSLAVVITGTRETGHRDQAWFDALFATYLGPWAREDTHFYIGGAVGIDSLSLYWLAGHSPARITVVVPGTVARQPEPAQEAIACCRARIAETVELGAAELRTPAYHARNRYMVDRAQMVIGFPLAGSEGSSGTWQTLNYGAGQGKARLIVPV